MIEQPTTILAGGALTIFVLREVFGFIRDHQGKNGFDRTDRNRLHKIWELHAGREAYNSDGELKWYVPREMSEATIETAKNTKELLVIQEKIHTLLSKRNGTV